MGISYKYFNNQVSDGFRLNASGLPDFNWIEIYRYIHSDIVMKKDENTGEHFYFRT